jgi:hypothetical protein
MEKEVGNLLKEALVRNGSAWLTVGGKSMWPFIRSGDEVKIMRTIPASLRYGEIIAVMADTRILVHRFRKSVAGQITIRGDFYPDSIHTLPADDLLGTVVKVRRKGCVRHITGCLLIRSFLVSLPLGLIWHLYRKLKQ